MKYKELVHSKLYSFTLIPPPINLYRKKYYLPYIQDLVGKKILGVSVGNNNRSHLFSLTLVDTKSFEFVKEVQMSFFQSTALNKEFFNFLPRVVDWEKCYITGLDDNATTTIGIPIIVSYAD